MDKQSLSIIEVKFITEAKFMLIGIPKEIKDHEYRVGISPQGARELVHNGHQVIVQKDAGKAIGFDDAHYRTAGAIVSNSAAEIYDRAEMIVKVKEPQMEECSLIKEGQMIFSYLHLAADAKIANLLLKTNCIAIAYETVTAEDGTLPLLSPMSEVAGRMAVQTGAHCLEKASGGRGVLLGGVPGVAAGRVVIIGGGVVGRNAAQIAVGMGAKVTIFDTSVKRLRELELRFGTATTNIFATVEAIEEQVAKADLVIGAVLIPGASAPKIVSKDLVASMQRGSVIVDVAIDQGGCIETSRPTTHSEPTYVEHDVVHYCVTNIPSAVARTSTRALENSTLPYIISLANKGYRHAFKDDVHFRNGLNLYRGRITNEAIAKDLNHPYVPIKSFLS